MPPQITSQWSLEEEEVLRSFIAKRKEMRMSDWPVVAEEIQSKTARQCYDHY